MVFDNSQVSEYRKCPMSYYLKYRLGLVKSDLASLDTLHIDFGKHYHKFLELYYSKKEVNLESIWSTFEDREEETVKTRANGIALCKAYIENYKGQDNFRVIDVEKSIELNLNGYRFIVKRDAVIEMNDNIYSFEHKTTGRLTSYYFQRYFIDSQMSAQSFVTLETNGQCSGVLLNVAQPSFVTKAVLLLPENPEISLYSQTETKYCKYHKDYRVYCKGFYSKFQRDIINRTKEELQQWKQNTIGWIFEIEKAIELNKWLRAESSFNCGGCQYKEICKVSKGTELDESIVDILYTKKDNPLDYLTEGVENENIS